jgi:hypothetical protein
MVMESPLLQGFSERLVTGRTLLAAVSVRRVNKADGFVWLPTTLRNQRYPH